MSINTDQLLNRSSGRLAMQKAQQEKMVGGGSVNIVLTKKSIKNVDTIKTNVVKIESILKGTLALDKKQLDDKKRDASKKRKEKIETKLETKPNAESGKISMPAAPRTGILDFIKNFIGNVLLGYFAVRLIKHLPKILPIVKFLGNAADFIIDVGGKLLNGLVSFIDAGYKAYDATRGFIKNLGGENFAKGFDKFIGAIDTALFLTTVLAGSMAMEAMSGDGGGGPGSGRPGGRPGGKPNVINKGFFNEKTGRWQGSFRGGDGAYRTNEAARRYAQRFGRDAATSRFGQEGVRSLGGKYARSGATNLARKGLVGAARAGGGQFKLPSGGSIRSGGIAALVMLIPDIINSGMLVSQGRPKDGIRTFLSAIAGVGAGMAAMAGITAGAAALGITGVGIPAAIALAITGFAASSAASFLAYEGTNTLLKKMGLFDNDPKTGKPYAYRSGGVTRGGRSRGRVKRTLSKGKYKRVLAPQKPLKTEFKDKKVKKRTEELDKTKYFGPILAISSKIMNKEEPTDRDYQNVGLGINLLIAKGIQDEQLKGGIVAAFANGGLVDPDVLSAAETGGDISNWVAKTFRGEIESNAEKTMRSMKEMREKKTPTPSLTPDGFEVGPAGTSGDKLTMARNLMRDLGLTADQAAGIVGNMAAESGVENARVQGSRPGEKGVLKVDGKTGYGIVQWTSQGRQQALADYAKSRGADLSKPLSMDIEYQFFLKEFKGKYGHVLSQIKQARDVKTASTIFMQQYEVPDGHKTEAKIMERYNMSKPIYDKLAAGQGTATAGPGTYIASPLGTQVGNLSAAQQLASSMGVPLWSHVRKDNPNSFHYDGRAMDFSNDGVGNGTPQQLSLANEFVRKYGATAKEIFYTPLGYSIKDGKKVSTIAASTHYNHVHIAFAKGGRIHKPIIALIGEKGPEFVFDADTTAGLDRLAPQLLEKLNFASTKPQLASILQSYAPYDASASSQTIVVQSPSSPSGGRNNNSSGGGVAVIPIPVDNFTEILAMIG